MSQNLQLKPKPQPSTFTIGSLRVSIDPAARVVVTPLKGVGTFGQGMSAGSMAAGTRANAAQWSQH